MSLTLHYSEDLVRRAVRRYCWGKSGVSYWAAFGLVAAILLNLVIGGDRSWVSGVMATVLLFGTALPLAVYQTQMNATLTAYRLLNNQPVLFSGDETSFAVQAATGSTKLPWSTIAAVRRYNDLWLLEFGRSGFMTFPLEGTSAAEREFVAARVKAHGGRVY